ncbi:hypothetical protein [Nocardia gipuzkoensis]|uniref:hypothetical protein n=1 Tax=Nocardia gipuzkoensis TaxID=2749991 RepID=UPI0015EEB0E6|nr:hypothetical protein [Nocardia gipuzkoensis]
MSEPNHQLSAARARTKSELTGHPLSRAELADEVNAWVYRRTGRVVQLSGNYIGKLERGVFRWPNADYRAGLKAVLGVETDAELGFRPVERGTGGDSMEADDPPTFPPSAGKEVDDVQRRSFLLSASAAGVGMAFGLESARHGLNRAVSESGAVDLDDWNEIIREYGTSYVTQTAMELHEMLLVDILSLETALTLSRDRSQRRELYKIGALLSQYMAQAIGDLGRRREGTRWWRTARYAADRSGDLHTIMYVRGRNAIRAIYDGQEPEIIIDEIGKCDPLVANGPAVGRPSLLAARAQSFALLGRAEEAELSLNDLRDTFAALPSHMTNDHSWHCWAYPEERVRFAESFVYSHLGDTRRAEEAQSAALDLYPPNSRRGPVQIELQRALCLVAAGDPTEGAGYAATTLERLPTEHRTRFVLGLGEQVLAAVPKNQRRTRSARGLHELLRDDAFHRERVLES